MRFLSLNVDLGLAIMFHRVAMTVSGCMNLPIGLCDGGSIICNATAATIWLRLLLLIVFFTFLDGINRFLA